MHFANTYLQNFSAVDNDDLPDALDVHDCRTRVNEENFKAVLLEIAHKELLQTPMFVCDCWKEVLEKLYTSKDILNNMYESRLPSNKGV